MPDEDDEKENENNEAGSNTQNQHLPSHKEKKLKKNIRFQIPDDDQPKKTSTPALPQNSTDVGNDNHGGDDHEDFSSQPRSSRGIHKKYILSPLNHSSPRSVNLALKCEQLTEDDFKSFVLGSSSRQLSEISSDSSTPSEIDLTLIEATYLRKLEAVKEALQNGANVNTVRNNVTSLLIAAEVGDTRMVSYLVTVPNINLDVQNEFGQTALSVAVRNSFSRIVKLLLVHKADVNLADKMGRVPLHNALFQQRVGLVKLLLIYGADYEKQYCFEERPLYISAIEKPHFECLLVLLKIGASPEYNNTTGISLLSRTILNETKFNIIEALVSYGASVNSQDSTSGKTPLHFAALTNNLEVAKLLVSKGADVNIETVYRYNPCEEAIIHGSVDVMTFLEDKTKNVKVKMFGSIKRDTSFRNRNLQDIFNIKQLVKKKKKRKNDLLTVIMRYNLQMSLHVYF